MEEDKLDCIRSFWQLTEVMRCRDVWYNAFLQQCRKGSLSMDFYSFFHGLPAFTSPCRTCTCNDDLVEDPVLGTYRRAWKEAFVKGCVDMASLIEESEGNCASCVAERKRRHRVLTGLKNIDPALRGPPCSLRVQCTSVLCRTAASAGIRQAAERPAFMVLCKRCSVTLW